MSFIKRFFNVRTKPANRQRGNSEIIKKNSEKNPFYLSDDNNFSILYSEPHIGDTYLLHAWVNIAVNILIRNIARADFTIKNDGEDVECGSIYDLFHRPNPVLSMKQNLHTLHFSKLR
jgi:hypothetical protein